MNSIVIVCNIDRKFAVRSGNGHYGSVSIPLGSDEVKRLSAQARDLLADSEALGETIYIRSSIDKGRTSTALEIEPKGISNKDLTEAVVRAIEARAAKLAEEQAAHDLAEDMMVDLIVSAPPEEWVEDGSYRTSEETGSVREPRMLDRPSSVLGYASKDVLSNPTVVARRDLVKSTVYEQRRVKYLAALDRDNALRDARIATEKAKLAEFDEKVRAFVIGQVTEYRRAAQKGLDVRTVGLDAFTKMVEHALEHELSENFAVIQTWSDREERKVPTNYAFEMKDLLVEAVEQITGHFPADVLALLPTPVYSIERLENEQDGEKRYQTAAVVGFVSDMVRIEVAVLAEEPSK